MNDANLMEFILEFMELMRKIRICAEDISQEQLKTRMALERIAERLETNSKHGAFNTTVRGVS